MSFILRLLLGLFVSTIGFLVVWKTETLVGWLGESPWAEWNLAGFGGTYGLYKSVGIIVIFIGFLVMTNSHVVIMEGIAGLFVR